jgi:putative ABC transport system permease protein
MLTLRAVRARAGSSLSLFALWTLTVLGSVLAVGLGSAADLPTGSALGLVLLGLVALAAHCATSIRLRGPGVALARLRGVRGVRLLRAAVSEPAAVLSAATVAGSALAAAGGPILARRWTGTASAFRMEAEEWTTSAVLLAAGLAVIVAASWRTTYQPLHDLIHAQRRSRPFGRAGSFLVLLTFFGAAVSTYQARQLGAGRADWLSYLSPTLIGLTAGQLAIWLLAVCCRAVQLSARLDARLPGFLTVRRLSRRAGAVAAVRLVVAGTVVASVATMSWVGSRAWSDSTARIETGGPVAYDVPTGALQAYTASHRADPAGRWLMAESASADPSGGSARDLFADTTRWRRVVGDFFAGTAVDDVTRSVGALAAGTPVPAVRASTASVRFTALSARRALPSSRELGRIRRGLLGYDFIPLQLSIDYVDDRGEARTVSLPPRPWRTPVSLGRGAAGYAAPVPHCRRACAVRGVSVQGRTDGRVRITALTFGRLRLLHPGGHALSPVTGHSAATAVVPRGGGLDLEVTDPYDPHPLLRVEPHQAGAIATPRVRLSIVRGRPQADGLDGASRPVSVDGRTRALPLLGREGVLLDLGAALRGAGGQLPNTTTLVVARRDTPPQVLRRLEATGAVGDKRTVAAVLDRIEADDAAVGVRLYLLLAVLGLLVCAVSVLASVAEQRRERRGEAAALRSAGVRPASLTRSYLEEATWLGAAVAIVGLVAAWVGCRAVLAVLPLVESGRFELGFDSTPRLGVLAGVSVGAGVFVALAVFLALRMVAASSPPDRLREGAR